MSYMIDKFKAGEVKTRDDVCGWYFTETNEFRPLMADAMKELVEAGLVSQDNVDATATAYEIHAEIALSKYAESQKEFWSNPDNAEAQRELKAEMRAAFGPGTKVVNCITGKAHKL